MVQHHPIAARYNLLSETVELCRPPTAAYVGFKGCRRPD